MEPLYEQVDAKHTGLSAPDEIYPPTPFRTITMPKPKIWF